MRIRNGPGSLLDTRLRAVASIGNYDGVHRGHQQILTSTIEHAHAEGVASILITFDPHPLQVVSPGRRPQLLQTRRQKLRRLEEAGLSDLLIVEFTDELARRTGEEFVESVLAPHLDLIAVHVGENFRFGRERSGNLETLREAGGKLGFAVRGIAPVRTDRGEVISSSAIRRAVTDGDLATATDMLGRPFSVTGLVVPGNGRGRQLDFPTANLEVENEMIPTSGVYVTEVCALAARYASVTNIGTRPTFGGGERVIEAHLLSFDDDLYGERMEVRFLERLRDEVCFPNPMELADQIARDRAAANAYFMNTPLRIR